MSQAEFDAYVEDYDRQHRESIKASGEDPGYFAEYKIKELKRLSDTWAMNSPSVVDFGSGMGNSLPALREYFATSEIFTADVSERSLEAARKLHGGSEQQLLIADSRIPADDGAFDLAFTACVFHHIPADQHVQWLSEIRRVTRPGGRLVLFEHNPLNPLTRDAVRKCPFDVNAVLISANEMRRRFLKAGWRAPKINYHIFFPRSLAKLRPLENHLRWCAFGGQYSCQAIAP
ncbi:class I SAM-dependent methyltransferase [Phaeobacter italicus]|jgi:SAM-dependent methyltransferase|uniref:class I SAM-dependent methyltransferase n=1 Tax=Phaeobacter italicus TaxID=481446 RepID=UPI001AD9E28E|nr:class I SAM-dependent methyltransferase [Phaeobacter italicus]MBO9444108.1 class I SAM-dependent methyltransferase [Phaeobacter italicus]